VQRLLWETSGAAMCIAGGLSLAPITASAFRPTARSHRSWDEHSFQTAHPAMRACLGLAAYGPPDLPISSHAAPADMQCE
jgi:hypothetical protein